MPEPIAPPHLIDTNIAARVAKRDDPQHALVVSALDRLIAEGSDLCYVPRNIVELWTVLTRPRAVNGFGLAVAEADREVLLLERQFTLLPDNERIHEVWRRLVVDHRVSGKQVHDTRLVAAMIVHGVTHLLTLDAGDFSRFPEITAVHPRALVASR
jgi:predicted nucleic acid-binding protein